MKSKNKILFSLAMAAASVAFAPGCRADGLDSLKDDTKLFNELSNRGMDELLDRAFDNSKTPPDQRESIRAIASLSKLTSSENSTEADRQEAIKKVAAAIDNLLPRIQTQPQKLIDLAKILSDNGIDREVAILEYWGESDAEKAKLKPIAEAAVKIYDQAAKAANTQADALEDKINNVNDPNVDAVQKLRDMAAGSQYQKLRLSYAQALSLNKTDPMRIKAIDDALNPETGLPQWDNADSKFQATIRMMMARMNYLKGEYGTANKLLDSIIKTPNTEIAPPPSEAQAFEARCYKIIVALAEEKVTDAEKTLADAQTQPMAAIKQNAAVLKLIHYRILALKADKAPDGPEKDKANAVAVNELGNLLKEFPDLQKVIFDQLLSRMSATPDYSKLDPIVLLALMQKGRAIIVKNQPTDPLDPQAKQDLNRALESANQILARATTFDKAVVLDASLLRGIFMEFRGEKVKAADALLDHIEHNLNEPVAGKIEFALDHTQQLIMELRTASPVDSKGNKDAEVERIEGRFMKIAIGVPFNRKQFALQYANQLAKQDGTRMEAVKYYRMVSDTQPAAEQLRARYGELFCLKNQLDAKSDIPAAERAQIVTRIQDLAGLVSNLANGIIKASKSDTEILHARSTLALTSLIAADVTRREQKNPQRVLDLLKNFEDSVVELPDAKDLLNSALYSRVQSYMQLGNTNDATGSLVVYLKSAGANEGAATIYQLLGSLNKELDKALADADADKAKGDNAAVEADEKIVHQIADNRAVLSGFLVDWASTSNDPAIKAYTYTARHFAAESKRLSASLETDTEKRKKELGEALDQYNALLKPENTALYIASLPQDKRDPKAQDLSVPLGIALIQYELGEWKEVADKLGPLIAGGKLGEDNDQVWEATYKLLDSMHRLAKAGTPEYTDAQVQKSLKILYLVWRDEIGGKKYHGQFEALRKEVMPDWNVNDAKPPK